MSRRTLARVWTDAEEALAAEILNVVGPDPTGFVAAISIVRAVGLPYGRAERDRSLRRIYDVMPLAVMRSIERFPGRALEAARRGGVTLYRVTDDPNVVQLVVLGRLQRTHTMLARASAEVEPLRARDDLPSIVIVSGIDSALASLPPRLLDALTAAVREPS